MEMVPHDLSEVLDDLELVPDDLLEVPHDLKLPPHDLKMVLGNLTEVPFPRGVHLIVRLLPM